MSEADAGFTARSIPQEEFLQGRRRQPVVFHFQPQTFALLDDPEDLRKWESLLVNRVGVSADVGRAISEAIAANGGTCCESGSTDDCDED
jgi:hypothetical protein